MAIEAVLRLAESHGRANDRVGLVGLGGVLRWVSPGMGAHHRHRIVDAVLDTQVLPSVADKGVDVIPVRALPARSLVVLVSPLLDPRSVALAAELWARRFDLAVVECSPIDFAAPGGAAADELAHRLWRLERDSRRHELAGRRRAHGRVAAGNRPGRRARRGDPVAPAAPPGGSPVSSRRAVAAPRRSWLLAGAAVAVAVAVTVESALLAPESAPLVGFVGGFGIAALAIALLTGLDPLVGPGVGFVVAAAAVSVTGDADSFALGIVADGVACFAVAELAYRSLESRRRIKVLAGDAGREIAPVVATTLAASAAGVLLLGLATAADLPRPPSVAAGVVAVLLLVGVTGGRVRP